MGSGMLGRCWVFRMGCGGVKNGIEAGRERLEIRMLMAGFLDADGLSRLCWYSSFSVCVGSSAIRARPGCISPKDKTHPRLKF